MEGICPQHSGLDARLINVEKDTDSQWTDLTKLNERIDKIMTRINVILGGITVAVLMLIINIILTVNGGS